MKIRGTVVTGDREWLSSQKYAMKNAVIVRAVPIILVRHMKRIRAPASRSQPALGGRSSRESMDPPTMGPARRTASTRDRNRPQGKPKFFDFAA